MDSQILANYNDLQLYDQFNEDIKELVLYEDQSRESDLGDHHVYE